MLTLAPLSGVRIWLSGSIPSESALEQPRRLEEFANLLADACFRAGATLVHGCHPTLVKPLLSAASDYRRKTGRKAPLSLVASAALREASGGFAGFSEQELREECEFRLTPVTGDRDRSLAVMRDSIASEADVLVAIGGKWWYEAPNHAGVPAEFTLALNRGIPTFLLGGLGGATAGYLESHPDILADLRNGLDQNGNRSLVTLDDVSTLVKVVLEQAARLPLGRREAAGGERFRILSLDGGGIRGAFTAAVLAQWEALSGLAIADHFDLIAGTSTGGILALGLGLGLPAGRLVTFYRDDGPSVFPMIGLTSRKWLSVKHWFASKFDAAVLEARLGAAFREARLSDEAGTAASAASPPSGEAAQPKKDTPPPPRLKDSRQRLLLTSYNLTSDELKIYRTSHHPRVPGHDHLDAVVVARATSAAPTYFDVAEIDDPALPHEAVDGGVWANCPALVALCEAVGVIGIPIDRIEMLSIGTTETPSLIGFPRLLGGRLGWAMRASNLFMKSQCQGTLHCVAQLLGDRFHRVDDAAATHGLDDVGSTLMLINKGSEAGQRHFQMASTFFLNGVKATPWRPLGTR